MIQYVIERSVPGAASLTDQQLREESLKSIATLAHLGHSAGSGSRRGAHSARRPAALQDNERQPSRRHTPLSEFHGSCR